MIDLAKLGALVANILGGVSILSVMIFAVVAWLKQLGLQGKQLTLAAFGASLLFSGIIRYAFAPPQTFAEWVWTGVFGFMSGLLATGAYKGAESILSKSPRPAQVVNYPESFIARLYKDTEPTGALTQIDFTPRPDPAPKPDSE